jgi:hypothetical protein
MVPAGKPLVLQIIRPARGLRSSLMIMIAAREKTTSANFPYRRQAAQVSARAMVITVTVTGLPGQNQQERWFPRTAQVTGQTAAAVPRTGVKLD